MEIGEEKYVLHWLFSKDQVLILDDDPFDAHEAFKLVSSLPLVIYRYAYTSHNAPLNSLQTTITHYDVRFSILFGALSARVTVNTVVIPQG